MVFSLTNGGSYQGRDCHCREKGGRLLAKGVVENRIRRFALLRIVLKRFGVNNIIIGFIVVYLVCAAVVLVAEPTIASYGDALWFLWAVSLTIGLGDVTAVTFVGRTAAVVCSLYALVTIAIFTGVTVDYYNEARQNEFNESIAAFLDKLEHLDELPPDELRALSELVRKRRH